MAKVDELKKRIRPVTWAEFHQNADAADIGQEMSTVTRIVEMQFDRDELGELPVYEVLELYHDIVKASYQRDAEEKN